MIHDQQQMIERYSRDDDMKQEILKSISDVGAHLRHNQLHEMTEKANVNPKINQFKPHIQIASTTGGAGKSDASDEDDDYLDRVLLSSGMPNQLKASIKEN